jgi:Zn-dependent protease
MGRGANAPAVLLAIVFLAFGFQNGLPLGFAAALGWFGGTASLLIHELGHVRAASRVDGIRGASVSLIWLGAATRLDGAYERGRDQTKVALAGPRASFGLAIMLTIAAVLLPVPVALKELILALALFNVALGAFNLVPTNPLDGHKIIVGLVWSATRSEEKARRLIRRAGYAWLALELGTSALLLVEKPVMGFAIAVVAALFYGQKRFLRARR